MANITAPFLGALLQALVFQLLLLGFCACGDPPELFIPAYLYTSAGFWVGAIVIIVRRPENPTNGDLEFIRWGLPAVVILGGGIALWYWGTYRGAMG